MKYFRSLIVLLLLSKTYASGVEVVGNNQCWYSDTPQSVKISSFNDSVSLVTNKDRALGELVRYLNTRKFDPKKIDSIQTYGLCGPELKFAFKVEYEGNNYCVRSSAKFKFDSVLLAQDTKGACEGISPSDIIVSIDSENVKELLQQLAIKSYKVKGYKAISAGYYLISFDVKGAAIKEIHDYIKVQNLARKVEFSKFQYHIANEFQLKSLEYERK